jgi:hypothetical protein
MVLFSVNGLEAVRKRGFNPPSFGFAYCSILSQTTSALCALSGKEVTTTGFVMTILAGTCSFEPLGGTFSCLLLGHR